MYVASSIAKIPDTWEYTAPEHRINRNVSEIVTSVLRHLEKRYLEISDHRASILTHLLSCGVHHVDRNGQTMTFRIVVVRLINCIPSQGSRGVIDVYPLAYLQPGSSK